MALRDKPARRTSPDRPAAYPLYNPAGPLWYYNHHLIPPHFRAPPVTFSSSFPPIRTAIHKSRSDHQGRMHVPVRSPSCSPLPTPSSSETRVGRVAPRKGSPVVQDSVDLLDGSDPWGTSWHHHSPYDIGPNVHQTLGPTSSEQKLAGTTAESGYRKTGRPGLASKSTSAINLNVVSESHLKGRKLSKHRTGGIRSLFSSAAADKDNDSVQRNVDVPASPQDDTLGFSGRRSLDKVPMSNKVSVKPAESVRPSLSGSSQSPLTSGATQVLEHKEKRIKAPARLARYLSVFGKSAQDRKPPPDAVGRENSEIKKDSLVGMERPNDSMSNDPSKEPGYYAEISQRVVDSDAKELLHKAEDEIAYGSSISTEIEAPFSMGELTIANPDVPSSRSSSPQKLSALSLSGPSIEAHNNGGTDRPESSAILEAAPSHQHASQQQLLPTLARDMVQTGFSPPITTQDGLHHVASSVGQLGDSHAAELQPRRLEEGDRADTRALAIDSILTEQSSVSRVSVSMNLLTASGYDRPPPEVKRISRIDGQEEKFQAGYPDKHRRTARPQSQEDGVAEKGVPLSRKSPQKEKSKRASTETYRLVRSPSDNKAPPSDAVVVGNEQWILVGSATRDRSSKDREHSFTSSSHSVKSHREAIHHREAAHTNVVKEVQQDEFGNPISHRRLDSNDRRSVSRYTHTVNERPARSIDQQPLVSPPSVPHKATKGRNPEKHAVQIGQHVHLPHRPHSTQALPPLHTVESQPRRSTITRVPVKGRDGQAKSRRPVSDVPFTAEAVALSAREAWEADRMWKGKSVAYSSQVPDVSYTNFMPRHTDAGVEAINRSTIRPDANYDSAFGSSHTAYTLQVPFHSEGLHSAISQPRLAFPAP